MMMMVVVEEEDVVVVCSSSSDGGGGYKYNNQPTLLHTCQPIIDGAALTFKCLQRSVSYPPVSKLIDHMNVCNCLQRSVLGRDG